MRWTLCSASHEAREALGPRLEGPRAIYSAQPEIATRVASGSEVPATENVQLTGPKSQRVQRDRSFVAQRLVKGLMDSLFLGWAFSETMECFRKIITLRIAV